MRFRILAVAGGLVLACSGCNKDNEQIKVYRLAKAPLESPSSEANLPSAADDGSAPAAPADQSHLVPSTDTPSNWESQSLSEMRKASFLVRGDKGAVADISLVILGAAAGNVLDNVNRWLSQLGQPSVSTEQLSGIVQHLPTRRGDVSIVDITGTPENGDASKDGRILAAMLSEEGKTFFFKMRGNTALIGTEKSNFIKWVSAVCGAGVTASTAPVANAESPQIKWEVPSGWTTGQPSAMRYASFTAAGEPGQTADISIVTFPGDGGSDSDNVNRWRQQIGLPAADVSTLSSLIVALKGADAGFSSVDMTGAKSRVLAAWIRRDGRTWFFKITGSNDLVEKEKPKFVKFLQSVRF